MLLIYGAYGYTGELVARRAVARAGIDDADAIRASIAGKRANPDLAWDLVARRPNKQART